MEFLIALLINLLIIAFFVVVVFWVIGLLAAAFEVPPKVIAILKAIIALIFLLWVLQILLGHAPGFYTLPLHTR